jgi:Mrp family chromosome partitioning ATPase
VVVTSSLPDEGKSLFASTLAEVVAEQGRRVLLIDAVPLAHPRREMERAREGAASDSAIFIANDKSAPYLIVGTPDGRLTNRGKELDEYLTAARSEYDMIVIKAPPVLMLSDATLLARCADVVVLLVHWRKTPAPTAAQAVRRLQDAGVRISGTVLSNVNLRRQAGTAAYDQSYYLARYGKFYASISS